MTKKKSNGSILRRGFTLSEMLIVIIVVAVLSAIAVPMYTKAIKRSRASDALKVLSVASARQEAYFIDNNEYAGNFGELSAPVKGLSGTGEVAIGKFKYAMDRACMVATPDEAKADYQIYKNFQTQQDGCVGDGCTVLMDLIPTLGSVGCDLSAFGQSDGNVVDDDFCAKNPDLCTTDPGGKTCPTGKVYNPATATCVCSNVCSGGATQNASTCVCSCPSSCAIQGQTMNASTCACSCPSSAPYVYNGRCNTCKEGSVNTSTGQCCPTGNCYDSTQGICRAEYQGATTESQICGGGKGTQTRSRTSGCPGSWGSWGTCVCDSGYTMINGKCLVCSPSSTQSCGTKCGKQTCSADGLSWGTCQSEGVCTSGAQESKSCESGYTGTQKRTCSSSCAWGEWSIETCIADTKECDASQKPVESQDCRGTCPGKQSRTVTCNTSSGAWETGTWGICLELAECSPPGTREEGTPCVGDDSMCTTWDYRICSTQCVWEGFFNEDILCDDSKKPEESQACGSCGTQTRAVTCNKSSGIWRVDTWGECTGEGVCAPGDLQTKACDVGYDGTHHKRCTNSCEWPTAWDENCIKWDCSPGEQKFCNGSVGCGGGGSYLDGCYQQTCTSSGKWGNCRCEDYEASALCAQAGGMWSFQACQCLCCGSDARASWSGTQPICANLTTGRYEYRHACEPYNSGVWDSGLAMP